MNLLRATLDEMPPRVVSGRGPALAWRWCDTGVIELLPDAGGCASVLLSAGIHGDETAPVELLDGLVSSLLDGSQSLAVRLLVVLGNPAALRVQRRYVEHDLNRMFSGAHRAHAGVVEADRAALIASHVAAFFAAAPDLPRVHYDLHTAIRASVFERFALLPHQGRPYANSMIGWLAAAAIEAVLVNREPSGTFSYHTSSTHAAASCTLELGRVRPFGHNDLSRYSAVDKAVRSLVAALTPAPRSDDAPMHFFRVVGELKKSSEDFELLLADDVANFTAFAQGTLVARDRDYRYVVAHPEERIVFPNRAVKPGLRAGLMVVEESRSALPIA